MRFDCWIGGDIDEEDLSDARINGGTVIGAAESYALRRIPGGQAWAEHPRDLRAYRRAILVSMRVDFGAVFP